MKEQYTATSDSKQTEILTIEVGNCTITSVYKLPNTDITFEKPINFDNYDTKIVLSDLNSHSTTWGYLEND